MLRRLIRKLSKKRKIIGAGARRVAFALGKRRVIKVAKSKYGLKSNKTEVIMFHSCPYPIKRHLAKITKHGIVWLVMKRYRRRFPKSKKYAHKLHKLKSKFKKNGILPYEMTSRHGWPNWQNLRLDRKGKIIVIDYGNFVYRMK